MECGPRVKILKIYYEKNSSLFTFPYDHTSSPAPSIRFVHTPLLHKQALEFSKGIANLPWLAGELSNTGLLKLLFCGPI